MTNEFMTYKLGKITKFKSGGTPSKKREEFWNGDIPWISANSLKDNRIYNSEIKITEEGLKDGSKLADINSILLLVRGSGLHKDIPVGIVLSKVAFNQDIKSIKVDDSILDPWYLLYWFMGHKSVLKWYVDNTAIGAGKFDIKLLTNLEVKIPSKARQKKILDIIKSIDDKIFLLRRQNETLEAIAQTLFKRWFVDFEFPGANGQPYKSSGGKMVPSELGEIPEGWKIGKINDCVSLIIDYRGKTPKKLGMDWISDGIPALSAKNIKNGNIIREDSMYYGGEELYKVWMKDELLKGDILLTSEAPLGEVLYIANDKKYILSQRLFALRVNEMLPSLYLYYWLKSHQGQFLLNRRATGSTVGGIRQEELRKVEIIIPDIKILKSPNDTWNNVLTKVNINSNQIRGLTKLRDTLLPKLMSGQIRVGE
jgi:type I restriction enzyme S subunit